MPEPRTSNNPRVIASGLGSIGIHPTIRSANRKTKACGRCGNGVTRDARTQFCGSCRSADPWFCREAS